MANLEYDDSAFAFFALTFTCLITFPYTYFYYRSVTSNETTALTGVDQISVKELAAHLEHKRVRQACTDLEKSKFDTVKSSYSAVGSFFSLKNSKKLFMTGLLIILWAFVYRFGALCYNEETQISQFDPYDILQLEKSATEREIKKKYRKLSIQWHPDQWATKSKEEQDIAEAKFIKIAKAYTALTDEVSRENYKKYGNPDGPQPMELSLGLPSFLLNKQNHNVVLLLYIILLVVVIPTLVFVYYTNSRRYSDKLILNETYQVLAYLLHPTTTMKHLVDVLALSAEFRRTIPMTPEIEDLFARFKKFLLINEYCPKKPLPSSSNLFKKWPGNENVYLLLQAHFHQVLPINQDNDISDKLKESNLTKDEISFLREHLDKVLVQCPVLVDAMAEVSLMRRSLKLLHKITIFRQCLLQAVYPYSPSVLKIIPGLDAIASKKLRTKAILSFEDIKKQGIQKDEFAGSIKGVKVSDEFIKSCKSMISDEGIPQPKITAKIGCLDHEDKKTGRITFEDKFGEKDVVTVYVILNFGKEEFEDDVGAIIPSYNSIAYNPYFPVFFNESINISVGIANNEEHLFGSVNVVATKEVHRTKLMFKPDFKKPGKYVFELHIKSRTCLGFDKKISLPLDVVSESDIEAYRVHPEDLAVEKSPGLFDVFETVKEEDSDFESDDEQGNKQK